MSDEIDLIPPRGSGGGGKGGRGSSPQPTEAKNTLRAKMRVRVLYAISEGPIVGLKTSDGRSVYLNDTQVVDPGGIANFEGVTVEQRLGDAVQPPIGNFPTVEDSFQVNVKVEEAPHTWPIRTLDLTARDRLKIIVQVNALYRVDSKGNINTNVVDYVAQWRPAGSGAAWQTWYAGQIAGKCVSPYLRAHSEAAPINGPIELRVGRTSPDPADSKDVSELYWTSYSSILDQKLSYPGTALVGITFDANQQSGAIPTATFDGVGLICEVPVNYDPVSRTYHGLWNGAFKTAYTNNPAWIFWTLATNPEYGAGSALASGIVSPAAAYAAASGLVDRWAIYSVAQYCDELVPNGLGSWEPRYVFNGWMQSADEAYRVLQAIASTFRGMLYWGNGQIIPVIDRPRDAVKLVTPANVIDGVFEYQGSSMRARHSVVRVRWRDPALNYRENIAVVEDLEMMHEVGVRTVDYEALGATSLSQATRMGKWVLYTEKYETGLIRYRASVDHINVIPGDVIAVQDPNKAGIAFSGRLKHSPPSSTTLRLDREVTFSAGQSYWLRIMCEDGLLSALTQISATPGTTDTITLASPLVKGVVPEAVWVIIASNVSPVTYQVLHIEEMGDETYEVSALRHYGGKFNFIEHGWSLNEPPTSLQQPTNAAMAAPTGLAVREYLAGTGTTPLVRVIFSWTGGFDQRLLGYEAAVMLGDAVVQVIATGETTVTFADLAVGTYSFIVRALGGSGISSVWARLNDVTVDGRADPPGPPGSVSIQSGIRNVALSWSFPDSLYRRAIEVEAVGLGFDNAADDAFTALPPAPVSGYSKIAEVDGTSYVHAGLLPSHVWYYRVRTVDVFGQPSAWVGPIGCRTSYLVAADIRDGILNTAKFASSIAPVGLYAVLPNTKQEEVIYNTADGKLYRWSAATTSYVPAVRAVDLDGQLASSQISALEASKLTGLVVSAQIDTLAAAKVTGQLTDAQIAAVAAAKVTGQLVNSQLAAIDATKITGQLLDAQIAGMDASKLAGTIAEARLASIAASKVTGQLLDAQIAAVAAAKVTGQLVDAQLAGLDASKLAGTIAEARLASIAASKVTGQITTTQITDSAISTPKIAAGAVTAGKVAANAITAGTIAAGAVTAEKLTIGSPSNICWNGDFLSGTVTGWMVGSDNGAGGLTGHSLGVDTNPASSSQLGFRVALLAHSNLPTNVSFYALWGPQGSWERVMPVTPGQRVQASVYMQVHGCSAILSMDFFDAAGALLAQSASPTQTNTGGGARLSLDVFQRHSVLATAPAGAAFARAYIRAWYHNTATPSVYFTRYMLGLALLNQTEADAWVPGGATVIQGGLIAARTVAAGALIADSITSAEIAANAITANEISANAVIAEKIAAGAVTAGKVAAGAITAETIAAGAVTATKLTLTTGNLNPDPFFDDWGGWWGAITGWTVENAHSTSWTGAMGMRRAAVLSSPGFTGTGDAYAWSPYMHPAAATQAGTQYRLRAKVRSNANREIRVAVEFHTWDGAWLGFGGILAWTSADNATAGVEKSTLVTAPAGAAYWRLLIWSPAGPAYSGLAMVADVTLQAAANASLIVDGAVQAAKIAAGAVTTSKLSVGSPNNVIWNSCATNSLDGWSFYGDGGIVPVRTAALNGDPGGWDVHRLSPYGGIGAYWPPGTEGWRCTIDWAQRMPVAPGQKIHASVLVKYWNSPNAPVINVLWLDAAGTYFNEFNSSPAVGGAAPGASISEDSWGTIAAIFVAPANARFAVFRVNMARNHATAEPILFICKALFGPAPANATEVPPWEPGGVVEITGGVIRARTIAADRIQAAAITATEIAANAIVADKIAANAVTASKIAVVGDTSNIVPDPSFEDNAAWTFGLDSGTGSMAWLVNDAGAGGYYLGKRRVDFYGPGQMHMRSKPFAVEPGAKYFVSAKVWSGASIMMFASLQWFDAAGASLGFGGVPEPTHNGSITLSGVVTAPANAVTAQVLVGRRAGADTTMAFGPPYVYRQATASLIVDGAIIADKLAANAVQADKIAAGAVTTGKLAVASAANWIWDSCFQGVRWGEQRAWTVQHDSAVTLDIASSVSQAVAAGHGLGTYKLNGYDTGVLRAVGSPNGVRMFFVWANDGTASTSTPITPGKRYHAAAMFNCHRCGGHINICWYDGSGNYISEVNSTTTTFSAVSGTADNAYERVSFLATAPANALFAMVRFGANLNGQANPYLFVTKTMFGESLPNATEVPPWEPGGITKISGGQIVTRSIAADRIVAGSISTGELAANAITADKIAANAVTFGKIAAGAVRSNEVAAGQLRAVHMAAETIISQSIQVADLIIGEAKIQGDAVSHLFSHTWGTDPPWYVGSPAQNVYTLTFSSNSARVGILQLTYQLGKIAPNDIWHAAVAYCNGIPVASNGGDVWGSSYSLNGAVACVAGTNTISVWMEMGAAIGLQRIQTAVLLRAK